MIDDKVVIYNFGASMDGDDLGDGERGRGRDEKGGVEGGCGGEVRCLVGKDGVVGGWGGW